MKRCALRAVLALTLALCAVAVEARAQSGTTTSTLTGIVTDTGGGLVPGATVDVKNLRTTVTLTAVTNSAGAFDVPALDAGVYRSRCRSAASRPSVHDRRRAAERHAARR